jgi:N-acetylmuramoyl-L-alanine amidase CwlA
VQASAHFVVKDRAVTCCVPIGEVAWHAGDGRNYDSVGIEAVPADTNGVFSDETVLTLRELVAYVRAYYRKQNPAVERHFDGVQKKDCPRWYTPAAEGGQERWNALLAVLEGHGGKK